MKRFLPALLSTETTPEPWLRRVLEQERSALAERHAAVPELLPLGPELLREVRMRAETSRGQVGRFWQRAAWLVSRPDAAELGTLEPVRDAERIFHGVAQNFRTELKVFAVLHEMRAAVALPLASFFLDTGEFSQNGVKRIVDTVLLVCNVLEWGQESQRGRFCLERINAIHSRFTIPDAAYRYVLAGIQFIPWEFNQRFGWRPMTEVERFGWFHAFAGLGRAMGIRESSSDFDEEYAWYREVSRNNARFAPNKRRLVADILGQVLARYPKGVRAVMGAAFVAGMDDVYLTAAELPRAPEEVQAGLRALFRLAGEAAHAAPATGPWLQSLLTSSVYPAGYELEELGVRGGVRPELRDMTRGEFDARVAAGELLLVIDGAVVDLGHFAEQHPGGRALLERHRGQDATQAFAAAPHSVATREFWKNYRVARWVDGATPELPELTRPVAPTAVLAEPRFRQVPTPESSSLEEFARALLPLSNARSRDPLTLAEAVEQLVELGGGG